LPLGSCVTSSPAARAFLRNWPINTVHVGNRSRCLIGQVSVHRQRCTLGNRPRCGCVAVRIRQRAALPRPGLGASATLHAGQPTSVRMRCGLARQPVSVRFAVDGTSAGSASVSLRFAFGNVPRYLGQVSVHRQRCTLGNRPRCGCGCGCGSHRLNVGNRSRWGAFACGLRCTSARPRCIGNIARWATDLGALRCGSHRLNVGRQRVGLGSAAAAYSLATVRIRSRYGSHRQRAALPRPGLGAFAGSP
jgi:hypothetical protein